MLLVAGLVLGSAATAAVAAPVQVVDERVSMVRLSADEQALYGIRSGAPQTFVDLDPQSGAVVRSLVLPTEFAWEPSFALSPDGAFAYVMGSAAAGTLLKIDLATFAATPVQAPLPSGSGALDIAISADGSRVYVGKSVAQNITVIDTATMTVVTTVPVPGMRVSALGIRSSPGGDRLYVTVGSSNNQVGVFDTTTNMLAATWSPGVVTFPMTVSPTGELFVFDSGGSSMSVLSPVDGSVLRTVALFPGAPATFWTDAEFSPDLSRIYLIVAGGANEIRSIDATTGASIGTIQLTGDAFWGMDLASDGRTAYTGVSVVTGRVLNIARAPVADSTGVPATGQLGDPYTGVVGAGPGTDVNTFQIVAGALPGGLTLDPATGQISGTPTSGGTFVSTIRVQNALEFSDTTITITVASAAPVIAALTPDAGPTAGGTSVTITGTNLQGATGVALDGVDVPFTDNGDGTLTITMPPHAAVAVAVTVTTPDGTSPPAEYTYVTAPMIAGLNPASGPTAGGTNVTISGTNLQGATAVTVDGAGVAFTDNGDGTLTITTPPHTAGPVDVEVTTPGGTSAPADYTYVNQPVIAAVSPDSGPTAGGTSVSITGTNLQGATVVTVDGVNVAFTDNGDGTLTITMPPHAAGAVDVTVSTPGGTSAPTAYTYVSPPVIAALSPDTGPTVGGTMVTITGTNLQGATRVAINGGDVPFMDNGDGTLTITMPPHAAGPVGVTVVTPGGTSAPMGYTYVSAPVIAALSPDSGPTAGGTSVTITGSNLQGATSVTLDGGNVAFTDNGDGTLTITTPPHAAGPVNVTVTTPGGSSTPAQYAYVNAPVIAALTPDSGPAAGGTSVTITGSNLQGATAVTVDGVDVDVPFTDNGDGTLTITSPPHTAGTVNVTVTTPGGTSAPVQFTYVNAPVIAALTPDSGPVTGDTEVTITGDNLQGATGVAFDGVDVPFTDNGDGTLTITTPPHAAGAVDVTITTPDGTSPAVEYLYMSAPVIASISATTGPTTGGTVVTLTGDNLQGATSVTIDGVDVPFTQNSNGTLTITMPPHTAGTVNVTVTTPGGTSPPATFTYTAPASTPPATGTPPTTGNLPATGSSPNPLAAITAITLILTGTAITTTLIARRRHAMTQRH